MVKTNSLSEEFIDGIIKKVDKRTEELHKKACRIVKGINSNSHPWETRKTILDALSCVSDNGLILGVLMQAEIWAESLNKTKYLTLPSD